MRKVEKGEKLKVLRSRAQDQRSQAELLFDEKERKTKSRHASSVCKLCSQLFTGEKKKERKRKRAKSARNKIIDTHFTSVCVTLCVFDHSLCLTWWW